MGMTKFSFYFYAQHTFDHQLAIACALINTQQVLVLKVTQAGSFPSKNRPARNTQILQVLFLQDLQDLVINLAHILKLFLQDINNLARILQEKLQDNFLARFDRNIARKLSCKYIFQDSCKIFLYLARKDSLFSASPARFIARSCKFCKKIFCTRFGYFCKTVSTGL